jgi:N-acetylneuraminate synthase
MKTDEDNQMMMLAGHAVGGSTRPFIIAEISGNHGGSLERAFELIHAAKAAGADAVKFQTYEPQTLTIRSNKQSFVVETDLWQGRTLFDLYSQAQTPFAWHAHLFSEAQKAGITAFSAPFDPSAVALLEGLDCPFYKIASCELVDIPLIKRVAETGKPMIMSTGMASMADVEEAVEAATTSGCRDLALLHCVSGYPTPVSQANLARMAVLQKEFGGIVGLSDHSIGTTVPVAAVAMGAAIIEKHICLAHDDGAVDSEFSLTPNEFKDMVQACHDAHAATRACTDVSPGEADSLRFRRSLYVVEPIEKGDVFTVQNVRSIRPAGGLHCRHYDDIIGQHAADDVSAGTALAWGHVENGKPTI